MMWDFPKKWLGLVAIIGTVLFLLFGKTNQYTERAVIATDVQAKEIEKKSKPKISDTKEQKKIIVIDMKGAVVKEGVYEMKEGDRVKDAIEKAGGFLPEADRMKVNLAQMVQDQMLLYVPNKDEQVQEAAAASKGEGKVQINAASKEQLEKITGIGSRKAESILKYREEHGPFQKIEDLLEIDGIGVKSLEKIKDQIIIP
ncbi:helix-hairpin-helix domain-containing protein [Bacillus mobilis]|uniref:Competence protein ComE n=2 Tax=Bacillus cereus group TaxID=86661 RepID=A0A1C4EUM4_BACCE|nr:MULTISPECIES: helix-hairpin-helix domain-containing protein [Bacillus cereus group]MCC2459444.1 helix-hairpin-helix domain-containing protein [Bacillus mobilis]MCU5431561.1 helix-hairpin-helix domain-containing protein [Bacillus mobilis]MCU5590492.1 helix-hairpin-helix domain-containing protein [Bacillus mobilis]MCU5734745.1 helix-hairpin-helix domain-containing protein [Bacillus mobilis]MCU9557398.1 helix-hairpin-helix domain-containing protein [Bacillus mobilis]